MQRLGRGLRVVDRNIPLQKDSIRGLRKKLAKQKHIAAKKPNNSGVSKRKYVADDAVADNTQVHAACRWSDWTKQVDALTYKDFHTERFGEDCIPECARANRIDLVRLLGDARLINAYLKLNSPNVSVKHTHTHTHTHNDPTSVTSFTVKTDYPNSAFEFLAKEEIISGEIPSPPR